MKKWMLGLLIVLSGTTATLIWSRQPAPLTGSVSAQMLEAGTLEVVNMDLPLKDESRATAANGDYPERPGRELPATVWYPATGGSYPLIVSSHGYSSMRNGADYLVLALVRLGYVVVAADYPLTNLFAKGGPLVTDVVNQPADVSFLIDSMLALNNDPQHPLHGKIDTSRIGATGISLGGMTSTMAGFDPHRRDPRIKAVVSVAGPSMMFGPAFYAHHPLPFLMIATPTDTLVNYEDNARPILQRVAGAMLLTIDNGSHTGFADQASHMRWLTNPDVVGCAVVMHNLGDSATTQENWYSTIGSHDDGVIDSAQMRICETDTLPQTINPVYQHWLTQLALTSFFEAQFNTDPTVRQQRLHYLTEIMPGEIPDVHIEQATAIAGVTQHDAAQNTTQMAEASAAPAP